MTSFVAQKLAYAGNYFHLKINGPNEHDHIFVVSGHPLPTIALNYPYPSQDNLVVQPSSLPTKLPIVFLPPEEIPLVSADGHG